MTLEEAYRRKCRVEITFKEGWGWVTEARRPTNVVRGIVSKSAGRTPVYILLRYRTSKGGFPIDEDPIISIREVGAHVQA